MSFRRGARMAGGRVEALLFVLAVLTGGIVRLAAFLRNPSLSIDEASLSRNILERTWTGLLQPLDYAQLAPPGFLWIQKAVVAVSGATEPALRAVPLAAACLTLLLAARAGRRLFDGAAATAPVWLMAISAALVTYGVTAKPYAVDVAAAQFVMLAVLEMPRQPPWRAWVLAAVAAATPLVSFAAVFALGAGAAALLVRAVRSDDATWRRINLAGAITWTVCAGGGVLTAQALLSQTDRAYMEWFWQAGFAPAGAGLIGTAAWAARALAGLFGHMLRYRLAVCWAGLVLVGGASLIRRRSWDELSLLAGPTVLSLGAALVHRYPLSPMRVSHFLVPSLLLLAVQGCVSSSRIFARVHRRASLLPWAFACTLALHAAVRTDVRNEITRSPVREYLERVRDGWREGDVAFIHFPEVQPYLFYARTRPDLVPPAVVTGTCNRGRRQATLDDLAALGDPARVWLAMRHDDDPDADVVRTAFARLGATPAPSSGTGFGYVFTIAHAASHPAQVAWLPPEELVDTSGPGWACYGVFTPDAGG